MSKVAAAQMKAQAQITRVDHNAALDIDSETVFSRLTGIICSIGPASRETYTLIDMIRAGMTIARLSCAEETQENHIQSIRNIREAVRVIEQEDSITSYPLAIALDTRGPEVQTGTLKGGSSEIELKSGSMITLINDERQSDKCSDSTLYIDYKNLSKAVKIENRIFIDNGLISLIVKKITKDSVECEIEHGGKLGNKKRCNFPGSELFLPSITEKDKDDLKFAIEQNVDIIFASFIRSAKCIKEIRDFLGDKGKHLLIVAKIENHEGVQRVDEILNECDGLLVARGDLGVEIPSEQIFLAQKMMIAKCNIRGKPVICSTEMLKSMTHKPRPTRAESSDVANAVLDGADCLMLVSETVNGEYPVKSVEVMSAICKEAESAFCNTFFFTELLLKLPTPTNRTATIAISTAITAMRCFASLIIALTTTGETAHQISKYRPRCPIVMVTRTGAVARQALLWRGVMPIHYENHRPTDWVEDVETRVKFAVEYSKRKQWVRDGDSIIIVTGWKQGSGISNTLRIITVE